MLLETDTIEPVAIIGLALRFPGDAVSPEHFWKMMVEKRCVSTNFPADRLNAAAFYDPSTKRNDMVSNNLGFLSLDMPSLLG